MPEMAALYNAGNAAVVANVGTLVKPIDRATYLGEQNNLQADVPAQLYSHADQVNQWQTTVPNGGASRAGAVWRKIRWPRRTRARRSLPSHRPRAAGSSARAEYLRLNGPGERRLEPDRGDHKNRIGAYQNMLAFDNGLKLVQAANTIFNRGVGFSQALNAALATAKINTVFPFRCWETVEDRGEECQHPVGAGHQPPGVLLPAGRVRYPRRADRESGPAAPGSEPVGQRALYVLSQELGADKDVVTFTASEFGRTLQPNGNAGTDHAWGSHHFVWVLVQLGRVAAGRAVFGQFPSLALGGETTRTAGER
jgi:uncharacterized protein (DUF1501 family)